MPIARAIVTAVSFAFRICFGFATIVRDGCVWARVWPSALMMDPRRPISVVSPRCCRTALLASEAASTPWIWTARPTTTTNAASDTASISRRR